MDDVVVLGVFVVVVFVDGCVGVGDCVFVDFVGVD